MIRKKSQKAKIAWNSPIRKASRKKNKPAKHVFVPLTLVNQRLDSLQKQANYNNELASIYAAFYRVARIIREAQEMKRPIKDNLELEGIISWEFMRLSEFNHGSLQIEQINNLEKELKEELVKLWKNISEIEVI